VKAAASLLALIWGIVAAAASTAPIDLHIKANGLVQFDSGPELNNHELRNQIRILMKKKHRPDIRLVPDHISKYDGVARVLRTFQQEGYGAHFGFTGISK